MRLVVTRGSLRRVLTWTQRVLFASAVLALGYCGFVLVDAWIFQTRASHEFETRLNDERTARSSASTAASRASPKTTAAIGPDGLIGRIEIPRLGLSAIVAEGIDKTTLRRAVGHIPGHGAAGNKRQRGHRRAPRYVLPAVEGHPEERHHHAHHFRR